MPQIFLSYRRGELSDLVDRIFDGLIAKFGTNAVFQDVNGIQAATDFSERIGEALRESKVLIALIGPNWAGLEVDGKRRIDNEEDWVRTELLVGLAINIPIVPVLLNRAPMLKTGDLPTQLARLARIQAISLESGRTFHNDMGQLIETVRQFLPMPTPAIVSDQPKPAKARTIFGIEIRLGSRKLRMSILALCAAIVVVVPAAVGFFAFSGPPQTLSSDIRLNQFERALTRNEIAQIQQSVCAPVTGNLGAEGSSTRMALQKFFAEHGYDWSSQVLNQRDLKTLNDMRGGPGSCESASTAR